MYQQKRRKIRKEVKALLDNLENTITFTPVIFNKKLLDTTHNHNLITYSDSGTDILNVSSSIMVPDILDNSRLNLPIASIRDDNLDSCNQSKNSLSDDLIHWSIAHNIKHTALSDLLKVMRNHNVGNSELPLCAQTLLKTPRQVKTVAIAGGKFCYFSLVEKLKI